MPKPQREDPIYPHPEWCRVALSSIGDAVMTTDTAGRITFMNPIAESLTGWKQNEAVEIALENVFKIINQRTRKPVESPTVQALRTGVSVGLTNHTLLISKDATERPIEDSAAPIRNDQGEVVGVVLVFRDITERYHQDRAVQAALAYADNIIATLREPFLVLDQGLKIKTANQSFYNTFHVQKDDTEGRFIYELGNGQWNIPRLRTLLDQVLSETHCVEHLHVEHDFPTIGQKIMHLTARRFITLDGQPNLILLAIDDITEHKQAEEKLRASEKLYHQVVDFMPAGVCTVDGAGVITFYNQQAATLWGRAPQLGSTAEHYCGAMRLFQSDGTSLPHDQTPIAAAVHHGHATRNMEMSIECPDGSVVYVRSSVSPLRDRNGQIIGAINVFHDVTERKQAEIALRTSEVRYRRLFQTAKDGILILDANTLKIIDANPFMSELLGYAHSEFLGKELWEIGFFGDKRASQSIYRELQEQGYVRYDHLPLETKNGQKAEVEFVSNVYQVEDKSVAQCNIRDVSERSRLERKTKEQAEALADLHRRKDEFLAMLSHELRNPLAPIMNAVHLLRLQSNEAPLQQRARDIIERQVTQLTRLVDDLMEISRVTTGRIQLRMVRVVVSGIVERAVESTQPLIDERQLMLTVIMQPEIIWLNADAARLEQVVVNLLNNAAKYTDVGGHIWLTVRQEGDECVIRVRDTGIGIAKELLPRIFDLFTQAERSLDRSQGGLGIGLALVQRLVEMHRGRVEVHSTLGKGSEFVVRLPMTMSPEPSPQATKKDAAVHSTQALRVLVVDDNVDAAQCLSMLLQAAGHDSRTIHDGLMALDAVRDFQPDAILLDIGLPGLNGFEIAKQVRLLTGPTRILLVAMTGYGQESDRQRSLEAGFDHHLVKPAAFSKLQQILATVTKTSDLMPARSESLKP